MAGLLLAASSHGHAPGPASTAAVTGCGGTNEALANCMAAAAPYDWTGSQMTCLDELWTEESGFSAYAANPTSDARGIAQNINGWSPGYQPGNASQQVTWGLLTSRAGTARRARAWTFETSHVPNWY